MSIKCIYFVDCENVGFNHIEHDSSCRILYFHSGKKPDNFALDKYEDFIQFTHNGCKDALDFVIDTSLGYELRYYGKSVVYYIVSGDNGYENISHFWGSLGFDVRLVDFGHIKVPISDIIESGINIDIYTSMMKNYRKSVNKAVKKWLSTNNLSISSLRSRIMSLAIGLSNDDKEKLISYLINIFINNTKGLSGKKIYDKLKERDKKAIQNVISSNCNGDLSNLRSKFFEMKLCNHLDLLNRKFLLDYIYNYYHTRYLEEKNKNLKSRSKKVNTESDFPFKLDEKYMTKVMNIYNAWRISKKRDFNKLLKQLKCASIKGVNDEGKKVIAKYLYNL